VMDGEVVPGCFIRWNGQPRITGRFWHWSNPYWKDFLPWKCPRQNFPHRFCCRWKAPCILTEIRARGSCWLNREGIVLSSLRGSVATNLTRHCEEAYRPKQSASG